MKSFQEMDLPALLCNTRTCGTSAGASSGWHQRAERHTDTLQEAIQPTQLLVLAARTSSCGGTLRNKLNLKLRRLRLRAQREDAAEASGKQAARWNRSLRENMGASRTLDVLKSIKYVF